MSELGQEVLASSLLEGLQLFGGPAFHGEDLAVVWDLPDLVAPLLDTPESTPAPG